MRWPILILLALATVSIQADTVYWNGARGMGDFSEITSVPKFQRLKTPGCGFKFKVICKSVNSEDWNIVARDIEGDTITAGIKIVKRPDPFGTEEILALPIIQVGESEIEGKYPKGVRKIRPYDEEIVLTLCWSDSLLRLAGHSKSGDAEISAALPVPIEGVGIRSRGAHDVSLIAAMLIEENDVEKFYASQMSDNSLSERLSNPHHPLEGEWEMADHSADTDEFKIGGDYRIGILKEGDEFSLIYIGGQKTMGEQWHRGMLKGRLRPSPYPDQLYCDWTTSDLHTLHRAARVSIDESGRLLTFTFEEPEIILRFAKIKEDN